MYDNETVGSAEGRYVQLKTEREPFLYRGRKCAELTLPFLLPEEGASGSTQFQTPYQSLGARGVVHLASKLLMALLPPNAPFFRLTVDDFDVSQLTGEDQRGKLEEGLSSIERAVMTRIETAAVRVPCFEALKQLIVAGNCLLNVNKAEGTIRIFKLDSYVVSRDGVGNLIEIVTHEKIAPMLLPESVQEIIAQREQDKNEVAKSLNIYTHIKLIKGRWELYQEVKGIRIPDSFKHYPKDKLPWLPLRFSAINGEDYGRGLVEMYIGDLKSVELLSQALVEGAQAAARILFLVRQNGQTRAKVIEEAPNGAVRAGSREDVSVLQMDKQADFSFVKQTLDDIQYRLSHAFLLNSAVQRNAERVTAEEIRYMANELEGALGGVYSVLSQEFQRPLVELMLANLESEGKMPKLPKNMVRPQITTGIEALGRGQDLNKLALFLEKLAPLGQDVLAANLNVDDYIARLGASIGIDTSGLIKSAEEKQAEQEAQQQQMQQQQMAEMMKSAAPQLIKQFEGQP